MAEASIVCYTAIFGAYDRLEPVAVDSAARFVCFTDQDIAADGWEVRRAELVGAPRRTARMYKTQPARWFPDAAYTMWVDGDLMPLVPPEQMVRECMMDAEVATFAHPLRDCIYEEANVVLAKRKDAAEVVYAQMNGYRREGYPAHNGLAETTMVLRAQSVAMERFGALWWEQIAQGSIRDQLSFNYCLWRLDEPWRVIPGYVRKHPWFCWAEHARG